MCHKTRHTACSVNSGEGDEWVDSNFNKFQRDMPTGASVLHFTRAFSHASREAEGKERDKKVVGVGGPPP